MKLLLLLAVAANAILIVSSNGGSSVDVRGSSSSVSSGSSICDSNSNEDCFEEESCGTNERYVDCPDALCEPETCDDLGYPQPCPIIGPNGECPGKPGCVCIEGYVRNCKGVCIPRNQCPSCGGDRNAVSGCGGNCGRLCSNYYKNDTVCTLICNLNGCDCKENYVYDEQTKECVLPEDCTNTCKKENEVFDPCPWPCPFRTCGIDDRVIRCAPGPEVGSPNCSAPVCRCKDGFYRNGDGECVTWEECPTCNKPNEVYDICPAPCPPRRCDVNEALILCIVPPKPGDPECEPGCRCADGYVKDAYDVCIPKEDCPKCTNPNEVFDPCPKLCPPRRCDVDERAIRCRAPPKLGDPECEPGCRCADGFVRNSLNVCVTKDQCNATVCNKINEVFDPCPSDCPPRRCDVDDRTVSCSAPLEIGDPRCKPGCRCADGYVKNYNGDCVTRNQCPRCTRPNEIFHPCPPSCPPQSCDSINIGRFLCSAPNHPYALISRNPISQRCRPSCICQPGYYRNKIGQCISRKDCLRCTGPHEYFSCGSACDNVCANLYKQNQTNCPIRNIACNRKCYCERGYARDSNNICIPINQCPVSCAGDYNAIPGCGVNCGRRCDDYFKNDVICPAICYEGGCDCRHGYVFDSNIKRCVRPEECSPNCGRNEYFSNCVNGGCDAKYCSDLGRPTSCVRPKYCIKGCLCKKGYLRAKNGLCIPERQCPRPIICGKHEVYEKCPPLLCQPFNCSQLGQPIACPAIAGPGCPWEPGCICENGYLRNDEGVCIPVKQCPTCGGDENAEAGCGINCGRLCSNYDKEPVSCIEVCYPNACDCKEGHVLDQNINKCVLPKQCTPQCGPNEQYDECPSSSCLPRNCSQLGYPLPCSGPSNCTEKPSCVCKDGYFRDENGICIPQQECPSCGGDPNAQPGCGGHCGRRCSTYNKGPTVCPAICYLNACDCKEGYVYDDNQGICVLPEQCTPACDNDEVYSECINGGCQAKNCSQLGKPVPCIKMDPKYCIKGCLCKEGYLRLENGVCVPKNECPQPQCKKNEEYSECPSGVCRPQKCNELGFPVPCPDAPQGGCTDEPACICKEGFLRNHKGDCIPQNKCPSCGGDPNAISGCGVYCNQHCSDLNNKEPRGCILICYPNSCDCKKGYYLDGNVNKCVRPEQCTKQCGNDEVYSECINGGCQPKNCSQLGSPVACRKIDPKSCIKGCLCKEDYLRLNNGTCVPKEECPLQCGKNEEYNACPALSCRALNCSQLGNPVPCPFVPAHFQCTSGPACICKDGYLRNDRGICVPENKCLSCGGDPNAQPGCGGYCGRKCSDYNKGPVACTLACDVNGCDCKKGYVFDEIVQKCVKPKQCTPVCSDNEVYSSCSQGECRAQNCTQLGKSIACPKIDPNYCKKECICKEGYLRNGDGVCVPEKECPAQCRKPHEVYDPCPRTCPPQTCEAIDKVFPCPLTPTGTAYCKGDCVCEDGYYRNKNKECISKKDCLKCTGPHEFFSCGSACDNECSKINKQNRTNCPIINIVCNKKCYCENGYARDKNGICIPTKQCEVSCGGDPNAVSGCGVNCNKHCSDLNGRIRPCPKICRVNGCDCKEGYYFDNNFGKCVLPKECTPECGKNEVYSSCIQGECRPLNCTQLGKSLPCPRIDPKYCKKGCLCKQGYARSDNGTCVPENECPSPCQGPHEVYDTCPIDCPPNTCDALLRPPPCPAPIPDLINCRGRCQCEEGYFRNKLGECITKDECYQCPDPHEYFSCGSACDNECSKINKQNRTNCPIVNIVCNKKCYCEDGYARAKDGKCIPIDECKAPQCGKDEVYVECPSSTCQPQNCSQLGYPIACPDLDPNSCPDEPACLCKDGYLRNKKGKCIPKEQCPSCGGDPNAQSGCGVNCLKHCSDLIKPQGCKKICYPNACDCKEGLFYDDIARKCVIREDCTPACGEHEIFEKCPNSVCQPQNCSQVGFPLSCDSIKPGSCSGQPSCICEFGYVRDSKGKCIPKYECPSCGGDPNAKGGCGVNCNKRCSDLNKKPGACILLCYPNGCDCDEDYYYDDNIKKCVLPEKCTPTCGADEVFSSCINGGCNKKNCSQINQPQICIDPIKCIPGCLCKKGYLRADNGTCVPENKCELTCTKPNEEYDPCPPSCPPQTCESINHIYHCPFIPANKTATDCTGQCRCKSGFFKNKKGECISKKNCLKCTGPNEYYSCGSACDNECTSLYKQNQTHCPIKNKKCTEQCYCDDGYARNENNTCIPIEDCPAPVCDEDEVYDVCVNGGCGKQNCSQIGEPDLCIDPVECEDGCLCKSGYLRDDDGTCVPEDECDDDKICPEPDTTTTPPPTTTPEPDNGKALENLQKGNIAYTGEFFYQEYLKSNGKSFVTSPFSVLIPLGQLGYFAQGKTYDQIMAALNLETKSDILNAFPSLIKNYQTQQDVVFELASKCFTNDEYPITDKFLEITSKYFFSEAQEVDFSKPQEVSDTINKYVADKTHDKIQNLVAPSMFNRDTRLALVNAVYFKGNWVHQFNENKTKTEDFYVTKTDTVPVSMMNLKTSFRYGENDDAQFLELPYKGGNFTCLIVLPKEIDGLASVIEKLRKSETFDQINENLKYEQVNARIPRLKIETTIDLGELFKLTGLGQLPNPESNDLKGIIKNDQPIYMSKGVQKAFIVVNEVGTEAAAANAIIVGVTSVFRPKPQEYQFNANHPFVLYIKLNSNPIFCTVFTGDKQ